MTFCAYTAPKNTKSMSSVSLGKHQQCDVNVDFHPVLSVFWISNKGAVLKWCVSVVFLIQYKSGVSDQHHCNITCYVIVSYHISFHSKCIYSAFYNRCCHCIVTIVPSVIEHAKWKLKTTAPTCTGRFCLFIMPCKMCSWYTWHCGSRNIFSKFVCSIHLARTMKCCSKVH